MVASRDEPLAVTVFATGVIDQVLLLDAVIVLIWKPPRRCCHQGTTRSGGGAPATSRLTPGIAAQRQERFEQAEGYYRRALDLYLEFNDRHSAARTYHQLGKLLAQTDGHQQAPEQPLHAALAWWQAAGAWPAATIELLQTERRLVPASSYDELLDTVVPDGLHQSLAEAAQNAD